MRPVTACGPSIGFAEPALPLRRSAAMSTRPCVTRMLFCLALPTRQENAEKARDPIVIISARLLSRECLARFLSAECGVPVICFSSIDEWLADGPAPVYTAIEKRASNLTAR